MVTHTIELTFSIADAQSGEAFPWDEIERRAKQMEEDVGYRLRALAQVVRFDEDKLRHVVTTTYVRI